MLASSMRFFTLAAVLAVALLSIQVESSKKGLAWATDNRWAKKIAKGQIRWYHHWQNAPVPQMPNDVQYIPMYWGPKYNHLWAQRKKHFKKNKPQFVLTFNEPDVKGQADMTTSHAASVWMKEIEPLRKRGIKVSSPQIVYNTKWMDGFLKKIRARGSDVDFMAVHYYGSWKDQKRLESWIKTIRKKYHKSIWLTEYGVTASSKGSAAQIRHFKASVTNWMDKRSYVKRVAWLGCFAVNNPPDSFASRKNAMFSSGGKLNKMAYSYMYNKRDLSTQSESSDVAARSSPGAKRHALQHHKRIIANGLQQAADLVRRNESDVTTINGFPASKEDIADYLAAQDDEDDVPEDNGPEEHCDELCKARDEAANEEGITDNDDEAIDAINGDDLDDE